MKAFRACLAVTFVFIVSSLVFAEVDPKTSEIMEKLSAHAEKIESYKVDMKIETQMMGQAATIEGSMAFKKPDKMHVVSTAGMMGGMKQETFSADNIVWTYLPGMNMATKIDMSQVKEEMPGFGAMQKTGNIAKPFEGLPMDSIKFIEKKTVDEIDVYVFESTIPNAFPSSPNQPMPPLLPQKMVLLLNVESGLPYKIRMFGKDDSLMMEQTYSNYRLNIPIDDSEFEFSPPEGVEVMDMTKGTLNMMRQMQGSQQAAPTPEEAPKPPSE